MIKEKKNSTRPHHVRNINSFYNKYSVHGLTYTEQGNCSLKDLMPPGPHEMIWTTAFSFTSFSIYLQLFLVNGLHKIRSTSSNGTCLTAVTLLKFA